MWKSIALLIIISIIVAYQARLLFVRDVTWLILSCALIMLCGHFYDQSRKFKQSLHSLTTHSIKSGSSNTRLNHSFTQRFLSVVEDTSDYVGFAELSGRYVYMNRSFSNVLELDDEYANDIYMFEWHSESNRRMLMDIALPTAVKDGLWIGESTLLTKTGKQIPVVLRIGAYKDQEGKLEYYSTVIRQSSTIHAEEEAKLSRLLLQRTMHIQENDRQKLAQELHDGLGQSLYSIMLGMQYLQGNAVGDRNKQLIQQWIDELYKALSIVKLFALKLRPHTLDQLGLSSAIKQLISGVRSLDNEINLTYDTNLTFNQRFTEEIEICLYRITQEALHNSLKHAHANHIHIRLVHDDTCIRLVVQDDGLGFIRMREKEGLGLRHIEERTYELRGMITIESIVDEGTTINVTIPLEG